MFDEYDNIHWTYSYLVFWIFCFPLHHHMSSKGSMATGDLFDMDMGLGSYKTLQQCTSCRSCCISSLPFCLACELVAFLHGFLLHMQVCGFSQCLFGCLFNFAYEFTRIRNLAIKHATKRFQKLQYAMKLRIPVNSYARLKRQPKRHCENTQTCIWSKNPCKNATSSQARQKGSEEIQQLLQLVHCCKVL